MPNITNILACMDVPHSQPAGTVKNEESENRAHLTGSGLVSIDLRSVDFWDLGVDNRTIDTIYELDVNDARQCHASGPRDEWLGFAEIYSSSEARRLLTLPSMGRHGFGHAYLFGEPKKGQYLDFDFQSGEVYVIDDEDDNELDNQGVQDAKQIQIESELDNYLAENSGLEESEIIFVSDTVAELALENPEHSVDADVIKKMGCWRGSTTFVPYDDRTMLIVNPVNERMYAEEIPNEDGLWNEAELEVLQTHFPQIADNDDVLDVRLGLGYLGDEPQAAYKSQSVIFLWQDARTISHLPESFRDDEDFWADICD